MRDLEVNLGNRSYTISIGGGLLNQVGDIIRRLARTPRVFLISNPAVFSLYGDTVVAGCEQAGLQVITGLMPDGEKYKNLLEAEKLIDRAIEQQVDRRSFLAALGGGVVGDLAGFVAAIYQRGLEFVQIPTTLLAQVDSSVGGKVAVNHRLGKNMIGAFYQPRAVAIDTRTLATLDEREFQSGMGEVVKYGIILDRGFFDYLEERKTELQERREEVLEEVIYRCCQLKAQVVEKDENEQGVRAILNLGHTFGHALETLTHYRQYRHGEAVAIGTVTACYLARDLGLMSDAEAQRIRKVLQGFGLPVTMPDIDSKSVLDAMYRDKKVQAGKLRLVIPAGIGGAVVRDDISDESILKAIECSKN